MIDVHMKKGQGTRAEMHPGRTPWTDGDRSQANALTGQEILEIAITTPTPSYQNLPSRTVRYLTSII